MDISYFLYVGPAILGAVGFFGWSHSSLREELDTMKLLLHSYLTTEEVREMIEDKIAPTQVGVQELNRRLDELRESQVHLSEKLDKVLEILNGRQYRVN